MQQSSGISALLAINPDRYAGIMVQLHFKVQYEME